MIVEDILGLPAQMPNQQRAGSAKAWPKEDNSPTPVHRTLDIYFDTYEAASAALVTPFTREFVQQLVATGAPSTAHFSDVEPA